MEANLAGGAPELSGVAGVTSATLAAGNYVLSESGGPPSYQLESLSCDQGNLDVTNNTLTLQNGDTAVCVFTNRDVVVDLSVIKSVDNLTPNMGDIVNFTLEVSNSGPDPAYNVVVDDIMPSGLTFVGGSMSGADGQNQSAPNLQWTINYLGVGAGSTLILNYQAVVN